MIAVGSIAEETKVRGTVTTDQSIAGTVSKEQGIKGNMIRIPSIDNTLTKEGYAADSKAVGDALNTKASSDHTHTASDVGARPNTWTPTAEEVGARPSDWMPTAEEVGAAGITHEATGSIITLNDSGYAPLFGLKLYGKTTQNGTPTPSAPVPLESAGDSGSIDVIVTGKNLIDYSKITTGVELSDTNGDTRSATGWYVTDWVSVLPNTTYTVSGISSLYRAEVDEYGNKTIFGDNARASTFTTTMNTRRVRFNSKIDGYTTPQLEMGGEATAYEPYNGGVATVSTPNGLPGIPVSSGGNYTDANGQQWICDEVDFARGVYMKRIGEVVYTGNESITVNDIQGTILTIVTSDVRTDKIVSHVSCTHFETATATGYINKYGGVAVRTGGVGFAIGLDIGTTVSQVPSADRVPMFKTFLAEQYANGTPVTAKYVLGTPIETPIPAEELAQYATLRTNKPNTTLFNSANADMEIVYCSPNTAVPVNLGRIHAGKMLAVNEHGFVVTEPKPTASDVGAVPTSRTVNGKALSSNITLSASDVGARPSTWTPTASDVGAAPSGYGLGANSVSISDCNTTYKNGFYRWDTGCANAPFSYAVMQSIARTGGAATQIVYGAASSYAHSIVRRRGNADSGEWQEWEHFNPRLVAGTPYRTIYKWKDQSVYALLLDMGTMPRSSSKQVDTGLAVSTYQIIGCVLSLMNESGNYIRTSTKDTFDYYFDGTVSGKSNWQATVVTTSNYDDYNGHFLVYYVKK